MKELEKKKGFDYCSVSYDFDSMNIKQTDIKPGVMLLHLFAVNKAFKFMNLDAEAAPSGFCRQFNFFRTQNKEVLENVSRLAYLFEDKCICSWQLMISYKNEIIVINGKPDKTKVEILYPVEFDTDFFPLASSIEKSSYDVHL